ncbi:hypothetical protein Tco_1516348 [Tanacetum coccineum]
MTMDDLLQVVPQLISRIDSLETDLKQTKLTMGNALVKLVKKVKKLEGFLKRRNMVLSYSEEEEPKAQGRKSQDDPLASLVQGLVTPSMTKVNASGGTSFEDIILITAKAAKTLSREVTYKEKDFCKEDGVDQGNQRKEIFLGRGTWKLSQLKNLSFEEVKEEFDKLTKTTKRLKNDEAKDAEPAKKYGKRRKQMARKGLHTDLDKDDYEGSDEVSEQDDSVSGTKIPINPVPVAMKSPSIATYKIIKQGEKGLYQIVREDGTDTVYINFVAMCRRYI